MFKQFLSNNNEEIENGKSGDFIDFNKKKRKRIIIITSILVLVLATGVYGYQKINTPKATTQSERIIPVQKGEVTETISATGTVQSSKEASLNFPNGSDKIIAINVKVGDQVKAGQVLAIVDSSLLNIQVKTAQANLSAAQARLDELKKGPTTEEIALEQQAVNKAKLSWDVAKSNYDEQKNQYNEGKIDQLQLEQAQYSVAQAEASYNMEVAKFNQLKSPPKSSELQSAQASVDQAKYQLQQQKIALENAILKAPMDGIILEVNGEVGETPSSGGGSVNSGNSVSSSPSKSQGFIVMDNSNAGELEVTSQVSQNDIGKVKVGMNATFTTTSFEGKEFVGKVIAISPVATTQSGVTTYGVNLSVDNKEQLLMPGMTLNTTITVGIHANTLYVPAAALKEQNSKMGVMVQTTNTNTQDQTNRSRFQEVTIGYYSTDKVEIVSGLKEGDKVIVSFQLPSTTGQSNQFRLPGTEGNRNNFRGDR